MKVGGALLVRTSCKIGGTEVPISSCRKISPLAIMREERTHCGVPQRNLNLQDIPRRYPTLRNQRLPPHIIIEEIQRLINQLFLPDHVLPCRQTFRHSVELHTPIVARHKQRILQILQPSRHLPQCVIPLLRVRIDGIYGSTHGLCDFADLGEERVAMSEDDEDVLTCFFARGGIYEGLCNVGVVHVEVTT